ncbi:serine/threonine protein kinase [Catenulispora sp. NL8]|uniref:non-specific serine/threonine protein kinase n=1 Tax=Catenulispora pinistramenti TaxID=2705254 RepID=A0ABS5KR22_9ACTN|nr:serine/threonine-protein kinase [Catenulispora pinistramenti]MBS2548501.1 serine/threonine protein kinase [Catenulispora pinistramenti]
MSGGTGLTLNVDGTRPGHLVGGRYELVAQIGHGGMGRVWEARDTDLGRTVAVKEVLLPALPPVQQQTRLRQARREGKNAAALADHPNIVTVYDVVVEDGVPWIIMQLVRGCSLRSLLRDPAGVGVADDADVALTPLGVERVAAVAEAMLDALLAMHEAGIVHRDIKPHNILMADDGRILLTDFGIAKSDSDVTVTVSGSVMGTMAYIAPERAEGETGTSASDFFSLGVTLFEAVEGFSPFEKKNSKTGTLTAILTKPLPPMSRAGRLAPLIQALTLKQPHQRPDNAQARALLAGRNPDTWRLPSPDEAGTESLPAQARNQAGAAGAGKGRLPWESITLTSSAGIARPPVWDQPQPAGSAHPARQRASNEAILAGIGVVLGIALLVGGIAWYHQQHTANQAAPPNTLASTPSATQPYVPPDTTQPLTSDPTTSTTSTTDTPDPTTSTTDTPTPTSTPMPTAPRCLTDSQALDLARTTNRDSLPSDTFVEPQTLQCDSGWGGARLYSDSDGGGISLLYRQQSDGTWATAFMGTDLCGDPIISQAPASIQHDLCPNLG